MIEYYKHELPTKNTYSTVPTTASVPEYGARAFHVNPKDSSNIEAAFSRKVKTTIKIIIIFTMRDMNFEREETKIRTYLDSLPNFK